MIKYFYFYFYKLKILDGIFMKTKFVLLSTTILLVVLTLTILGQATYTVKANTDKKKHDMAAMMDKPTADVTVEGTHFQVWIMTHKQHKKMMKEMKGMKHDGMKMDKAMKEAMMAGTHHIMLEVTDAASGTKITTAKANVQIASTTKKNNSVDLMSMMNHYGGDLNLDEKGKYKIIVNVNVDGKTKTFEFQYKVK
jgi:hypothetical protein